jgi:hypothetical protein
MPRNIVLLELHPRLLIIIVPRIARLQHQTLFICGYVFCECPPQRVLSLHGRRHMDGIAGGEDGLAGFGAYVLFKKLAACAIWDTQKGFGVEVKDVEEDEAEREPFVRFAVQGLVPGRVRNIRKNMALKFAASGRRTHMEQ